ncbi:MAG TPA: D-2-hydroxyacid dehydrogenase [Syntrophorhabdales bacterium]|nr:D-2-hydroxyacid dehydrogenase [Syntrophorhabdales bacterium]
MNQVKVLIFTRDVMDEKLLAMLRQVSPRLVIEAHTGKEAEKLGTGIWRDVEVLFTTDPLPPEGGAPHLRWIQGYYAGVDRWGQLPFKLPYIFTTTSGIHVHVAELVMALMLSFARKLRLLFENQQKAAWPPDRFTTFEPYELRDSTVGIIGYGVIGRQVGTICRAFGMRVLAADRPEVLTVEPPWRLPGSGTAVPDHLYDPSDIKSLLKESDYVVLCVPYTPQTRGMINADTLAAMKPTAVLINVARGNVVDEPALIEALKTGKIRGAGLDVFSEEPLPPTSPFWKLPNVIACPHVAGLSPHYLARAMTLFAENLRRYLAGEPLLNVVQKERGY